MTSINRGSTGEVLLNFATPNGWVVLGVSDASLEISCEGTPYLSSGKLKKSGPQTLGKVENT